MKSVFFWVIAEEIRNTFLDLCDLRTEYRQALPQLKELTGKDLKLALKTYAWLEATVYDDRYGLNDYNVEEEDEKEIMRRENEENIANGGSKMMPAPIMKEEDMVRIIKRQKNGKAAGTDGVKAETMKHMIRNKRI